MTTIDTTFAQVQAIPVPPATPQPARINADAVSAERRGRGQDPRREQSGNANFRAVLDSTTFAGLGQVSGRVQGDTTASAARVYATTILRTPSKVEELNGQDTMDMYRAARAATASQRSDDAQADALAGDGAEAPSRAITPRESLRAASQYAQRFFSVDGTFARRGETLELST